MLTCEFCMNDYALTQLSVLQCGHAFHAQCLPRCLEVNPVCPRCRAPVNRNDVIRRIFVDNPEESSSVPPDPAREPTSNVQTNAADVELVALLLEQNDMLRDAAQQRFTATNTSHNTVLNTIERRPETPLPVTTNSETLLNFVAEFFRSHSQTTGRLNRQPSEWRVSEKLAKSRPRWVIARGDVALVIGTNRVELFSHSTISTNLERQAAYIGSRFKNFRVDPLQGSLVDLRLNSNAIVYRSPNHDNVAVIFDLATSRIVSKLTFDGEISNITTSGGGVFAVTLRNCKTSIYRRGTNDDDAFYLLMTLRSVRSIAMSATGMVAYQKRDQSRALSIHLNDAVLGREVGMIDPDFDFDCFRINDKGTLVAVHRKDNLLQIFDVTTKVKTYQCQTAGFGLLARNCFSTDARFVAFRDHAKWTILSRPRTLSPHDNHRREHDDIPINDDYIFGSSSAFRKIDGVHYFQYVKKDGTLKMYKFSERYEEWLPIP